MDKDTTQPGQQNIDETENRLYIMNAMFHHYVRYLSNTDGWYEDEDAFRHCVMPTLSSMLLCPLDVRILLSDLVYSPQYLATFVCHQLVQLLPKD